MALLNLKQWLRDNIKPYLKEIKVQIASLGASVTGSYKGAFTTKASMPVAASGDWCILTADDGANESGIYVRNAGTSSWDYIMDISTFQEITNEIIASQVEFDAGVSSKAPTVAQVKTELDQKAQISGDAGVNFSAADANELTQEVVTANQFNFTISNSEAAADYASI